MIVYHGLQQLWEAPGVDRVRPVDGDMEAWGRCRWDQFQDNSILTINKNLVQMTQKLLFLSPIIKTQHAHMRIANQSTKENTLLPDIPHSNTTAKKKPPLQHLPLIKVPPLSKKIEPQKHSCQAQTQTQPKRTSFLKPKVSPLWNNIIQQSSVLHDDSLQNLGRKRTLSLLNHTTHKLKPVQPVTNSDDCKKRRNFCIGRSRRATWDEKVMPMQPVKLFEELRESKIAIKQEEFIDPASLRELFVID